MFPAYVDAFSAFQCLSMFFEFLVYNTDGPNECESECKYKQLKEISVHCEVQFCSVCFAFRSPREHVVRTSRTRSDCRSCHCSLPPQVYVKQKMQVKGYCENEKIADKD